MDIKLIDDKHFFELLNLYYTLMRLISPSLSNVKIVSNLLTELSLKDSLALGLFKGDSLVGFILGYKKLENKYFFSNMYILKQYRFKAFELMCISEEIIKNNGYMGWEAEGSTKEGRNILAKYIKRTING